MLVDVMQQLRVYMCPYMYFTCTAHFVAAFFNDRTLKRITAMAKLNLEGTSRHMIATRPCKHVISRLSELKPRIKGPRNVMKNNKAYFV